MDKISFFAFTELLKPITWFPPMWAFSCGVIASGESLSENWNLILVGLILAGPMVCASSQAVNDWFDREVDAINQPNRPIPSGRIPGNWGLIIAILWTVLSLLVASFLGTWGFVAALVGLILAWAYSMPPIRLKTNGWYGNAACGISYEGIAWATGAAVMAGGAIPEMRSLTLAFLYSLGAHGIMTLNDFKSIKGDKKMGISSLPVKLGVFGAAKSACITMLTPQFLVFLLLISWNTYFFAAILFILIILQMLLMRIFLNNPLKKALFYSAVGVPIFVSGMMISAFALRSISILS
ncbi:MAG: bacteriochlorophyll/chlorophyll a synthase [Betaproteobacteria bacterium TMED156]|nr:MAG: bacteriochlorophyll/chlorophyll a synthase [Betaproteobacteria bacterium TMED156]|tara:strand:- start:32 stop:916 length:885 start_codon:yes stop_codon:yes gene_type:complete